MFKSHRKTFTNTLIAICVTSVAPVMAHAQVTDQALIPQGIVIPSTSSSFNQNGFNLPTQPFVTGQDIVKSTTGVSCQSAVGSSGPKLDMGVIGSNDLYDRDSVSVYGRLSFPIGKRPKRVDCTRLYDLEISRLKMELQLLRAGVQGDFAPTTSAPPPNNEWDVLEVGVPPRKE